MDEKLKAIVELNLIEDLDDFDLYFDGFIPTGLSFKKESKRAYKWAFDNNLFEYFFQSFKDELEDVFDPLLQCDINLVEGIYDVIELKNITLNNKTYYFIYCNTDCKDMLYSVENGEVFCVEDQGKNLESVIDSFKSECLSVFTVNGEFDYDDLIGSGNSINFFEI